MRKRERLMQLELLLLSHPDGMRRAEIARRIGVHRSTVGRYIDELKKRVDVWEDGFVIGISSRENLDMMRLSVYESLAFHLSAELLAGHIEYHNPHVASGLRKLSENMRRFAPSMSENIDSIAEAIEVGSKKHDPDYIKVLETLTDSWVSGKMVKIIHENNGEVLETEFAPYFIGFFERFNMRKPISVTGRLRHAASVETIDIKNIKEAKIVDETYTIPDNLRAFRKWDEKPLKSPDMMDLVLEISERSALNAFQTIYYEDLKISGKDDQVLICKMKVENSIELILRIFQCGNAVKIVEPQHLQERYIRDVKEVLALYE